MADLTMHEKRELCARKGCGHPRFAHSAWGLSADDPCNGWSEYDDCEAGDGEGCQSFVPGSGLYCCEWEDTEGELYCARTAGPSGRCERHEVRDAA